MKNKYTHYEIWTASNKPTEESSYLGQDARRMGHHSRGGGMKHGHKA